MKIGLTNRQLQFCQEYVLDYNGFQACLRIGHSKRSAAGYASTYLALPSVIDKIAELRAEILERTKLKAEDVLDELKRIAFVNMQDFVDENNNPKNLAELTRDQTAAIQSIKKVETDTAFGTRISTVVDLHDKKAALQMLGQHLGIFEADNSQRRPAIQINIVE